MEKSWKSTKKRAVTFSFDDGVTQDIQLIRLLNKYNLKCTFNLNSELLGKNGILNRESIPIAHYKIWPSDVKNVYEGHEVAVHTLTHPRLPEIADDSEIICQVEQDRLNLSELVGYNVQGMAYPCGGVNNDDRVAKIIKENTGVKYSRTIKGNECFDLQDNLYRFDPTIHVLKFDRLFELGKKFLECESDEPQLFYIWGHAYEMDIETENWLKLEEFFKFISNRNDIFYGTNREVLL